MRSLRNEDGDDKREHNPLFILYSCCRRRLPCLSARPKLLMDKTTILHVHHTSWYISLPPMHDYDVKPPNFTF